MESTARLMRTIVIQYWRYSQKPSMQHQLHECIASTVIANHFQLTLRIQLQLSHDRTAGGSTWGNGSDRSPAMAIDVVEPEP